MQLAGRNTVLRFYGLHSSSSAPVTRSETTAATRVDSVSHRENSKLFPQILNVYSRNARAGLKIIIFAEITDNINHTTKCVEYTLY